MSSKVLGRHAAIVANHRRGHSGTTAASVALANAGVQMYGLVVSCCAVSQHLPIGGSVVRLIENNLQNLAEIGDGEERTSSKPVVLLDPTHAEAVRSQGSLSLSCMPAMASSTNVSFEGLIARHALKDVGILGCDRIRAQAHACRLVSCDPSDSQIALGEVQPDTRSGSAGIVGGAKARRAVIHSCECSVRVAGKGVW